MTSVVVLSPQELEEIVSRAAEKAARSALKAVADDAARNSATELWDAEKVAEFLSVSVRQVSERYTFMQGFPRPTCLPTPSGTKHTKRWDAQEIISWAKSHKKRQAA